MELDKALYDVVKAISVIDYMLERNPYNVDELYALQYASEIMKGIIERFNETNL